MVTAERDMRDPLDDLAGLLEHLHLSEARLARRRQTQSGLVESDRAAMRLILESSDADREVTPGVLAQRLRLSPAAATALVDRLVAGGFVTVRPHATDRRKKLIEAVDRTLDPDHLDPLTVRLRALAAGVPVEEARIVSAFLRRVVEIVEDATPGRG